MEADSTVGDLCEALDEFGTLKLTEIDLLGFIISNIGDFETVADLASFFNLLECLENLTLIDVDILGFFDLLQQQNLVPAGATAQSLGITS